MILLAFIFGSLGAIAVVLMAAGGLCLAARTGDEWLQEHRDEQAEELDEWYRLPSCESRTHRSVR